MAGTTPACRVMARATIVALAAALGFLAGAVGTLHLRHPPPVEPAADLAEPAPSAPPAAAPPRSPAPHPAPAFLPPIARVADPVPSAAEGPPPPPSGNILGIVLDPEGRRVGGVQLWLQAYGEAGGRGEWSDPLAFARSSGDGTFSLTGLHGGATVQVRAEMEGFLEGHSGFLDLERGEARSGVLVRLHRGARALLRVRAPSGSGLEGAEVAIFDPADPSDQQSWTGRTPPGGQIRSGRLLPGHRKAWARHEDFPDSVEEEVALEDGRIVPVELRFPEPIPLIRGHVLDRSGRPVPKAHVRSLPASRRPHETQSDLVRCKDDGSFRVRPRAREPHLLWAGAGGDVRSPREVSAVGRAEPGMHGIALVLGEEEHWLHGQVLAPGGGPVEGATVEVAGLLRGTPLLERGATQRTPEDGTFSFGGAADLPFRLVVRPPGGSGLAPARTGEPQKSRTFRVAIASAGAWRLDGSVVIFHDI